MSEFNKEKENILEKNGVSDDSNVNSLNPTEGLKEDEDFKNAGNSAANPISISHENNNSSFGKKLKDYIISFGLAIIIAILFRNYVFARADVDGRSMEATLHDKDVIFVEKLSLLTNGIRRGQIIIFDSGNEEHEIYVKRVIAVEGDELELRNGKVYLNGKELKEDYLKPGTVTRPGGYLGDNKKIKIAPGEFFVMGDNREYSKDSREIGPVSKKAIKGHTIFRVYPFNNMRFF